MKCSLVSPIFLKWSLVFPILLFSSFSLHFPLKKPFLSLLAILWNSAFRWVYLSFFLLPFAPVFSSAICNAFSDNHFALWYFVFLGMVLITVSCEMLWTSVHSSERVTGRKARGLQMEEIGCKCQTILSLVSSRRKQTSDIFFLLYTHLKGGFS